MTQLPHAILIECLRPDGRSGTWLPGSRKVAFRNGRRFFKTILQPRDVFEQIARRVRYRKVQMHLGHIADMWNHRPPVGKRKIRDHQPFRDTCQPHGIGLNKVHGARREELLEMINGI